MKSIEEILSYESQSFDGRDLNRLADFMTVEQMQKFNLEVSNPNGWKTEELTRENVLKRLESDLAFAFEKALNKRGLSAGLMYGVIKMWMWVLDEHDDLVNWSDVNYAQYGLPYLKAVALRYGLPNEIGDDAGDESQYSADWE